MDTNQLRLKWPETYVRISRVHSLNRPASPVCKHASCAYPRHCARRFRRTARRRVGGALLQRAAARWIGLPNSSNPVDETKHMQSHLAECLRVDLRATFCLAPIFVFRRIGNCRQLITELFHKHTCSTCKQSLEQLHRKSQHVSATPSKTRPGQAFCGASEAGGRAAAVRGG